MSEIRNAGRILVRILKEINLPGIPRHRWENDIKMGLQDIGC